MSVEKIEDRPAIDPRGRESVNTADKQSLIGQRVPRVQDDRMLKGNGWYVDDVPDAGVLHAAILRSPVAAGRVTGFDAADAIALPGVRMVLGPDDLDGALQVIPSSCMLPGQQETDVQLYTKSIRFVGQPLAIVVAENRATAEDALELIDLDLEETLAVASIKDARAEGAPLVRPEFGSNEVGQIHIGDSIEELEGVFASADTVIDRNFLIPRIGHNSIEPRGLVAQWIPQLERLQVHSSTQVPHNVRQELRQVLGLRADQVQVVATDVGGGFGLKTVLFPDEALVCLAARRLGGKVKWIEDRSEALVASHHGRGQDSRARLALDADGNFLALHMDIHGDIGAFSATGTSGSGPHLTAGIMAEGPYRYIGAAGATVTTWYTNCVPTGAFRGYGMVEATFMRERLVDEAARVMGLDPVELRMRNMYSPEELPVVTRLGVPYDKGNYPEALRRVAKAVATKDIIAEPRIRRGIGYASGTELTGFAPTAQMELLQIQWGGWESTRIRINEDGSVTIFSGVTSIGQGIETALTQIAAEVLGVPLERISVQLGDTEVSPYSLIASQASRGLTLAGAALLGAATRLRERMDVLAAYALKAPVEEVRFDGEYFTSDAMKNRVGWTEVAHQGWMGWGRESHDEIALEELGEYDPASMTYAYFTTAALVSVDLDTGKVRVEAYWITHDAGVLVNPMIVEGQTIGGTAQGIGEALMEQSVFSKDGQPTSTTYLDYNLPLSEDIPDMEVDHLVTPSDITPGGFKGVGEGGTIPTAAAIANAVAAAVPEIAEQVTAIPLTPNKVWGLLDQAGLTL